MEITAGTSSKAVPATAVTIEAIARLPVLLLAMEQPEAKRPNRARTMPAVLPKRWLNRYASELTKQAHASGPSPGPAAGPAWTSGDKP
ncbi:hypothetical protein AHiyo4_16540 [Arthrobacter sp. Hiyo4]|nr:hypothetical protein AHiyo4_16540 [Arthrobacter sp. Hiyo4]